MDEQNTDIFAEEEEIDIGSSGEPDFDPFADVPEPGEISIPAMPELPPQTDTQPQTEEQKPAAPTVPPTPPPTPDKEPENPLVQAMTVAEDKDANAAKDNLISRAPKFVYAGAAEEITDTSKTFEDLRREKESDFPELEDAKKVTWHVEYGKITKTVADAKGTSIGKMKTQIETSKEFLESLKKMKPADREGVVCRVKPVITAQKKGRRAALPPGRIDEGFFPPYKALFLNECTAEASGKAICLIPAYDGKVYELRKNEIGTFITPAKKVKELPDMAAGFFPAVPRVPSAILSQVISFFRTFMNQNTQVEALVHVLWDKELEKYRIKVPEQTVTKTSVNARMTQEYDAERYIHVMDIHSHNSMPAKFSATDDADEKATRVYAVIGRLDRYWPQICVRISNGGKYLNINPSVVFEDYDETFPDEWTAHVELPTPCSEQTGGDGL